MKSIEERLDAIEKRLDFLESYHTKENGDEFLTNIGKENLCNWTNDTIQLTVNEDEEWVKDVKEKLNESLTELEQKIEKQDTTVVQSYDIKPPMKKAKDEVLIGKYIIGALAAVLIFCSATSFSAVVWILMKPWMRLSVMIAIGLIMTTIGFKSLCKNKNAINSIVLGIGAGIDFISILSANLAFHMIGNVTALVVACIWSISFIMAYKYTKTIFTTVIAYIGSFITLVFGLSILSSMEEYIMITLFTLCVATSLIVTSNKWMNKRNELILSTLSLTSFVVLFLFGVNNTEYNLIVLVNAVLVVLITNRVLYVANKLKIDTMCIPLILIEIAIMLSASINNGFNNKITTLLFMLFTVCQFIFIEFKLIDINKTIKIISVVGMVIGMLSLYAERTDMLLGTPIIIILLILVDRVKQTKEYKKTVISLMAFELVLMLINQAFLDNDKHLIIYTEYILMNIATIGYMVYNHYKNRELKLSIPLKIIAFSSYMVSIYIGLYNMLHHILGDTKLVSIYTFGYTVVMLVVVIRSGYFKYWNNPDFRWFGDNADIRQDKSSIALYIATTLLYLIGLGILTGAEKWYEHLIIILFTIIVMMAHSVNIIKNHKDKVWSGVWVGVKFVVFVWYIMNVTFNVDTSSIITSLVGLLLALGFICIGFKIRIKGLRLYGLVVAIVVVIKFMFIDLVGQNSILRMLALALGGIICFVISLVYTKLEKLID